MFSLSKTRIKINQYRFELQTVSFNQIYEPPLNPPLCPPLIKGGHTYLWTVFSLLLTIFFLLVVPDSLYSAKSLYKIEIPGSITIAGVNLSGSNNDNRYTIGDDLNTINATGFTIYNIYDQDDSVPVVRISSISDEEYQVWDAYKAIILNVGPQEAIKNRFISPNFRLIGYFPAADKLLLNQNGFMYAIYSGITMYDINYNSVSVAPAWEGGTNGNNAYIVGDKFSDFHGIRSQHIYDLSNPDSPRLIETSNDFRIRYHHSRRYRDKEIFEGCENLAIHPVLGQSVRNDYNYQYDDNKAYSSSGQITGPDQLNVEKDLGYLSHYIVGFRLFNDDNPDNLVLDIDSPSQERHKSLNSGVLGIYPSPETGQFYINDNSGLYIFEKQSANHNNLSMLQDKKPVILSSKSYPNPFNPQTTIEFELKMDAYVSLKIFNALGEQIKTLVSEKLIKGTYKRTWNARNVASGVYFYRLIINKESSGKSESYSHVDRLILLK